MPRLSKESEAPPGPRVPDHGRRAEGAREASPETRAEKPARNDEEERAARARRAERAHVLDEPRQ